MVSKENLVWCDLEMSGLEPDRDVILEMAFIVTDKTLNVLDEGFNIAVHQPDAVLDGMDDWNREHHGRSGLIERVKQSKLDSKQAEELCLEYLRRFCAPKSSPLCGNSICQDRRFLARHMRTLNDFFHYRNIDVSSFKELAARWYPQLPRFEKKKTHQALSDIIESIEELKYYARTLWTHEGSILPRQDGEEERKKS